MIFTDKMKFTSVELHEIITIEMIWDIFRRGLNNLSIKWQHNIISCYSYKEYIGSENALSSMVAKYYISVLEKVQPLAANENMWTHGRFISTMHHFKPPNIPLLVHEEWDVCMGLASEIKIFGYYQKLRKKIAWGYL